MNSAVFKILQQLQGNYIKDDFDALYNRPNPISYYMFMAYVGQYEIAKSMFPRIPVEQRYDLLMAVVHHDPATTQELTPKKVSCSTCEGGQVR